uniref:DUF7007 domain-containing protein n=1 Tax=viral metagenome TaxID=1070528 RepID=A0A6M3K5G1_9ZZZZ
MAGATPWGISQTTEQIAEGIIFYSTASHGGYGLSRLRMREFLDQFPEFETFAGGPWFEEDFDSAMIPVAFPEHFPAEQVAMARDRVRSMASHGYERFETVARSMRSSR